MWIPSVCGSLVVKPYIDTGMVASGLRSRLTDSWFPRD